MIFDISDTSTEFSEEGEQKYDDTGIITVETEDGQTVSVSEVRYEIQMGSDSEGVQQVEEGWQGT